MRILLQTTIPFTPDGWSVERFCDYNWDTRAGAPSFVTDPPADDVIRTARVLLEFTRSAAHACP